MFGKRLKPVAEICLESKLGLGDPDFSFKGNSPLNFTMLLVCLFLKMRWLLTGQEELENFRINFIDMIEDEEFPDSISGISSMPGLVKAGKTKMILYKNKNDDLAFISYFPLSYSNIDIINVGVAIVDKVTSLFENEGKRFCKDTFRFFKKIIIDDNEDDSTERLMLLIAIASEYIRQLKLNNMI